MKKIGLIPCRLTSTRLPNKPMKIIEGLPMFAHVYKRSELSNLDEVYICTDSDQIKNAANELNINCVMTKSDHKNGTERCKEAAEKLSLNDEDLVIDVQGDEPMVNPNHINTLINVFLKTKSEIIVPYIKCEEFNNPNIVKILAAENSRILYMSRSDIPHFFNNTESLKKHLSIIAFSKKSLSKFCSFQSSKYELIEGIELLRAIENSMDITTIELEGETKAVDTYDDLKYVRAEMPFDPWLKIYNNQKL